MNNDLASLNKGFMSLPNKFLSDLVIHTKYSNFIPNEHRKQNWNECVDVLQQMHMEQYPKLTDEIVANSIFIRNKLVLPSMRSIQFGGSPIKFAPNRMYNCAFVAVDDPFVFSEIMFLLLCGVGVGYSVQKRHVSQLPEIRQPQGYRRFLIPDSIEGWSDAVRALVYAYMRGKPMPRFDYGDIRPKGSMIKKTGGLAPGSEYLKEALEKTQLVLNNAIGRKLEPMEVHDIICYGAESVIAGGVRTSALISLFDKNDMKMLFAKSPLRIKNPQLLEDKEKEWVVKFKLDRNQQTSIDCYNGTSEQILSIPKKNGSYDKELLFNEGYVQWYMIHKQREMSNNSVVFKRGETTEDEFMEFWEMVKENKSGEPGIYWTNDYDMGTNPCKPLNSLILTPDGYITFKQAMELEGDDMEIVIDGLPFKASKPFKTGENKEIVRVKLSSGDYLYGTPNHKHELMEGGDIQISDMKIGDYLKYDLKPVYSPFGYEDHDLNNPEYVYGLLIGWLHADGNMIMASTGKDKPKKWLMRLWFGENEFDVIPLFEKLIGVNARPHDQKPDTCQMIATKRNNIINNIFDHGYNINKDNLEWLYGKTREFKLGFLRSFFMADGSPRRNTLVEGYSTRFDSLQVINNIIKEFGIYSNLTVHHNERKIEDGYSRNSQMCFKICIDKQQFDLVGGFIGEYKQSIYESGTPLKGNKSNKTGWKNKFNKVKVVSIERNFDMDDVYDIKVQNDDHHFVDTGVVTHNCGEISIKSKQFCNLTTSVVYGVKNQKQLNTLAKTSAFFGTLQAGYTDFHYLRPEWREVTQEDALLGCSMTGVASGNVLKYNLETAAKQVLLENSRIAKIIGINEAKRATTMKPEGTGTLAAGVLGNGIHAIHSEYFDRNVRIGKHDPIYHYLKSIMPDYIDDEFGKEKTRAVVSIPIKSPTDAIYRNESVFDLLNRIKRFSNEWVTGGHREGINKHNVSATVYVKDHEWTAVSKWMWDNREAYAGITILPYDGGIYKQAPFVEINKQEYKQRLDGFPKQFNFDSISSDINIKNHVQDPACSGGSCELTHV